MTHLFQFYFHFLLILETPVRDSIWYGGENPFVTTMMSSVSCFCESITMAVFFPGGHLSLEVSRESMLLSSLSRHNKGLEWQTLKPPRRVTALGSWIDRVIALRSRKDCVIALRQISVKLSVTALFCLEDSRKIHLRGARARRSKDAKRRAPQRGREREKASFGSSFYSFPLPGPVLCKVGRPGVLVGLPEVLTLVLGPSFVLFSRAFPFFVF